MNLAFSLGSSKPLYNGEEHRMQSAQNMEALQSALVPLVKSGKRVALVPTMGALHAGHMELVNAAKYYADVVVMSIFVNPTQFGPNEDFAKYPGMLEADLKKAGEAGVAIAYTPSVEDIYPEGFLTSVSVGDLGKILCGAFRPGHFDGVATIVSKLLLRTLPHVALFGEKDYQQLCVIRRVVYDLDIPVEIIGVPTVREADGLALSSRNAYLTAKERETAPKLHATLVQAMAKLSVGGSVSDTVAEGKKALTDAGFKVDYLEVREEGSLKHVVEKVKSPSRLLVAAWLGKTRLIDNIAIG
jgi:pantoate--beta-alanine ligase